MPTSFRHHYVPQMLSKRFSDAEGMLWYFNTPEAKHGVKQVSTKGAFWRKHYNTVTFNNGQKVTHAEAAFNMVENPASLLLDYILAEVRADRFPQLDDDARGLLDLFFFYQFKRSPDVLVPAMADFDPALELAIMRKQYEEASGQQVTDAQLQALMTPENFERLRTFARIMVCLDPGNVVRQVYRACGLHFYVAPAGNAFVIGSNPVIRSLPQNGQDGFIAMPIASDILMVYGHPALQGAIGNVTAEGVADFNGKIWAQSSALAAASEAAVTELVSD